MYYCNYCCKRAIQIHTLFLPLNCPIRSLFCELNRTYRKDWRRLVAVLPGWCRPSPRRCPERRCPARGRWHPDAIVKVVVVVVFVSKKYFKNVRNATDFAPVYLVSLTAMWSGRRNVFEMVSSDGQRLNRRMFVSIQKLTSRFQVSLTSHQRRCQWRQRAWKEYWGEWEWPTSEGGPTDSRSARCTSRRCHRRSSCRCRAQKRTVQLCSPDCSLNGTEQVEKQKKLIDWLKPKSISI